MKRDACHKSGIQKAGRPSRMSILKSAIIFAVVFPGPAMADPEHLERQLAIGLEYQNLALSESIKYKTNNIFDLRAEYIVTAKFGQYDEVTPNGVYDCAPSGCLTASVSVDEIKSKMDVEYLPQIYAALGQFGLLHTAIEKPTAPIVDIEMVGESVIFYAPSPYGYPAAPAPVKFVPIADPR